VDYLRMQLELSPTEYMETSRDLYETAMAYQCARANGINDARDEDRKRREREAKSAAALKRLRGR
jgi:hypothetical protein